METWVGLKIGIVPNKTCRGSFGFPFNQKGGGAPPPQTTNKNNTETLFLTCEANCPKPGPFILSFLGQKWWLATCHKDPRTLRHGSCEFPGTQAKEIWDAGEAPGYGPQVLVLGSIY